MPSNRKDTSRTKVMQGKTRQIKSRKGRGVGSHRAVVKHGVEDVVVVTRPGMSGLKPKGVQRAGWGQQGMGNKNFENVRHGRRRSQIRQVSGRKDKVRRDAG